MNIEIQIESCNICKRVVTVGPKVVLSFYIVNRLGIQIGSSFPKMESEIATVLSASKRTYADLRNGKMCEECYQLLSPLFQHINIICEEREKIGDKEDLHGHLRNINVADVVAQQGDIRQRIVWDQHEDDSNVEESLKDLMSQQPWNPTAYPPTPSKPAVADKPSLTKIEQVRQWFKEMNP